VVTTILRPAGSKHGGAPKKPEPEDDERLDWPTLGEARDPAVVRPGVMLVARAEGQKLRTLMVRMPSQRPQRGTGDPAFATGIQATPLKT
jgi:hypothetical protein